jgi:hypothetical protein
MRNWHFLWVSMIFFTRSCPSQPGSGRGPAHMRGQLRRTVSQAQGLLAGQGFGFEFRTWLAVLIERIRSRSSCGVRTRDEYTKRTGVVIGGWSWRDSMSTIRRFPLCCGFVIAPAGTAPPSPPFKRGRNLAQHSRRESSASQSRSFQQATVRRGRNASLSLARAPTAACGGACPTSGEVD